MCCILRWAPAADFQLVGYQLFSRTVHKIGWATWAMPLPDSALGTGWVNSLTAPSHFYLLLFPRWHPTISQRGMTGKLRGFQNKRFQEQAAPLEQFLCATSNSVLEPEGCFRNLTARNSLRAQCPDTICPNLCKYRHSAASGRLSSPGQL